MQAQKMDFDENPKSEKENSKIDCQMQKLEEQMLALKSKMEQSNEIISNVQFEIKQMTTANVDNYKKELGNVKPGRVVNATVTENLGVIIRGLPEVGSSPGDRMHRDLENADNLLKFLSIPDRKPVDCSSTLRIRSAVT